MGILGWVLTRGERVCQPGLEQMMAIIDNPLSRSLKLPGPSPE